MRRGTRGAEGVVFPCVPHLRTSTAALAFAAAAGVASAQPPGLTLTPVGSRDCTVSRPEPSYRRAGLRWRSHEWLDWAQVANYATALHDIFGVAADDIQVRLERTRCRQRMTAAKADFATDARPEPDRCPRGAPNPPYDRRQTIVPGTGLADAAMLHNKSVYDFRRRAKALDDLKTRVEAMRCDAEAIAVQLRAVRRVGERVSLAPARIRECRAGAEQSYVTPPQTYSSVAGNRDYGIILTQYSYLRSETLGHMTELQGRIEHVRCLQAAARQALRPMLRDPSAYRIVVRGQPEIQGQATRPEGIDDALRPRAQGTGVEGLQRVDDFPDLQVRPQPPNARCALLGADPSYHTAVLEQRFGGGRDDPWQSLVPNTFTEGTAEFVAAFDDLQARMTRLQCEQDALNAELDFLIDAPR